MNTHRFGQGVIRVDDYWVLGPSGLSGHKMDALYLGFQLETSWLESVSKG